MTSTHSAVARPRLGWRARAFRFAAIATVFAIFATGAIVAGAPSPAFADKYPSWNDVVHARKSAHAKKAQIKSIRALIKHLDANVKATAADAQVKGDAYATAQEAYYSAALRQKALEKQAAAAEKTRKESAAQAGQLAAQLARSGSNGFQLNLFLNGAHASDVLDSIGDAGKISERANGIYKKALQDKNTAQALTDQARVAAGILDNLKIVAQNAYQVAQKSADAAATALDASTAHRAELEGQLAALTTKLHLTEKGYVKGLQVKYGFTGSIGTEISSSGWARPTVGVITSPFGMRINPIDGGYRLHTGVDLADGCGVPIYAAHTGTVTYAGWYGDLGNFIQIQDSPKYANGYGHIVNGGILVHIGETVHVGQLIARTGMTGGATGCHLHYMVIHNGYPIDPVPFMRAHGITLG